MARWVLLVGHCSPISEVGMAKVRKYPEAFEEYYGRCEFADSNVFHHPNQFEVVKHLMYLAWVAGRRSVR